jgi:hypothetical protein
MRSPPLRHRRPRCPRPRRVAWRCRRRRLRGTSCAMRHDSSQKTHSWPRCCSSTRGKQGTSAWRARGKGSMLLLLTKQGAVECNLLRPKKGAFSCNQPCSAPHSGLRNACVRSNASKWGACSGKETWCREDGHRARRGRPVGIAEAVRTEPVLFLVRERGERGVVTHLPSTSADKGAAESVRAGLRWLFRESGVGSLVRGLVVS